MSQLCNTAEETLNMVNWDALGKTKHWRETVPLNVSDLVKLLKRVMLYIMHMQRKLHLVSRDHERGGLTEVTEISS